MDLHAAFLKEKYQGLSVSPDSEWPPSVGNQYIRLVLIEHENRLPSEKSIQKMQEDLLRGRVDQVEGNKKRINISSIFAGQKQEGKGLRVLVDGAPGVGKTTLCRKISNDWACKGFLSEYKLVVLLHLRDHQIAKAVSIQDFFYNDNAELQGEVVSQVRKTYGAGVLFIFDGFDELSEEERMDRSLFLDIIKGEVLHRCSVLVTSRPYASENLQCLHSVVRHVEVLGFAEQQIHECIRNTIKDKTKVEAFVSILKQRVDIISLCYIPLNCAILLYVYLRQNYALPATLTELFQIFILHALKRAAKSRCLARKVSNLTSLPPPLNSDLEYLCKLSFHGLVKDKMVFQYEEIEESKLLGLMTAFKSFSSLGDNVTYQFLHLTIQEFLAARWIATQMPRKEQAKFFKNHLSDDRFRTMLLFLAGITKLDDTSFNSIFSAELEFPKQQVLLPTDVDKQFFFLVHFLYESQNPTHCHTLACAIKEQTILLNGYKRSFQLLIFAFFLQRSRCTWKLLRFLATNDDLDILLRQLEKEPSDLCSVSVQQLQVIENGLLGDCVRHISVNKLASISIFKNLIKLEIIGSFSKVGGTVFLSGSQVSGTVYSRAGFTFSSAPGYPASQLDIDEPTSIPSDSTSVCCLMRNGKLKELTLIGILELNDKMIEECIAPELTMTKTLRELNIGSATISSCGFCSLFRALKDNRSVNVLHVSMQLHDLRSPCIGHEVESALRGNEMLRVLSVQMSAIQPIGLCVYNGLFRAITSDNSTLKVLTIDDANFNVSKGIMVKMLHNNKSLTTFSLNVGHLHQEYLDVLAAGLAQNTSLTELWVRSTQETREPSLAVFFDAVSHNSSLKALQLDLKFTTITDNSDPFSHYEFESPDTSDRRVGTNNLNDFVHMLMANKSLESMTFICNFSHDQLKAIAESLVLSGRQTKVEFRRSSESKSHYGSVIQEEVDKYKEEFLDMLCSVLRVYDVYRPL